MPRKSRIPEEERRRVRSACEKCRKKKQRCNGEYPCSNCTAKQLDCRYTNIVTGLEELPYSSQNGPEMNPGSSSRAATRQGSTDATSDADIRTQAPLPPPVRRDPSYFLSPMGQIMLSTQTPITLRTAYILRQCGADDVFPSRLETVHDVGFIFPSKRVTMPIMKNNNDRAPILLLYTSLFLKHDNMERFLEHYVRLLLVMNSYKSSTEIPEIGNANNPDDPQLDHNSPLVKYGASCLVAAIKIVWRVKEAVDAGHMDPANRFVLHFLFSACLIVMCHEYVAPFDTNEALVAGRVAVSIFQSWSDDHVAYRAAQIVIELLNLTETRKRLNDPHGWRVQNENANLGLNSTLSRAPVPVATAQTRQPEFTANVKATLGATSRPPSWGFTIILPPAAAAATAAAHPNSDTDSMTEYLNTGSEDWADADWLATMDSQDGYYFGTNPIEEAQAGHGGHAGPSNQAGSADQTKGSTGDAWRNWDTRQ